MKFAFELVPALATRVESRHQFQLSILNGGAEIPESLGSDIYRYHAMLLPGQPITATGRAAVHDIEPDLKGLQGIPGVGVDVPLTDPGALEQLTVRLDNNLILSQEILQSFFSLRCHIEERSVLIPLKNHLCRASWVGLGVFEIEAGALCRYFLKGTGTPSNAVC